jgi:hypothetical protein
MVKKIQKQSITIYLQGSKHYAQSAMHKALCTKVAANKQSHHLFLFFSVTFSSIALLID